MKQAVVRARSLLPCVRYSFPLSVNLCFQAYRGRSGKTKAFVSIWGFSFPILVLTLPTLLHPGATHMTPCILYLIGHV